MTPILLVVLSIVVPFLFYCFILVTVAALGVLYIVVFYCIYSILYGIYCIVLVVCDGGSCGNGDGDDGGDDGGDDDCDGADDGNFNVHINAMLRSPNCSNNVRGA